MSGHEAMMLPAVHPDTSARIALPPGVELRPLPLYPDVRGRVGEFFPADAAANFPPAQWSFGMSDANVMRGMHVHLRHRDWLVVLDGELWAGLCDLRAGSPAYARGLLLALRGIAPTALHIPPGVAHGLLATTPTTYVLGADRPYDPADELGCRWDDAGLGIAWPLTAAPLVSERDRALPPLAELAPLVPAFAE